MADVSRHPSHTLLLRLVAAGSLFASVALLGCQDPPPSASRADRLAAGEPDAATAVHWADDVDTPSMALQANDEEDATDASNVVSGGSASSPGGFTIRDLSTSAQTIAGAERFTVKVTVSSPQGDSLKAYGIKTPYEDGVHAFATLPMAVRDGAVQIKVDPLSTMPKKGHYPFEFWLVNDRREASNHLRGDITVQ
jgi:hypothetical protein